MSLFRIQQTHREPQKASPCAEARHTTYRPLRSAIHFCTANLFNQSLILCFAMSQTLPPKCPFPFGHMHPYLIHGSLCPPDSASKTASRLVLPFLHSSQQSVPTLYNESPPPPEKLSFSIGDLDRITRVHKPNGILIGSAIFAELTTVTDRPTDIPRCSVCNNRAHLRT